MAVHGGLRGDVARADGVVRAAPGFSAVSHRSADGGGVPRGALSRAQRRVATSLARAARRATRERRPTEVTLGAAAECDVRRHSFSPRPYWRGEQPMTRLNAVLNALSDS